MKLSKGIHAHLIIDEDRIISLNLQFDENEVSNIASELAQKLNTFGLDKFGQITSRVIVNSRNVNKVSLEDARIKWYKVGIGNFGEPNNVLPLKINKAKITFAKQEENNLPLETEVYLSQNSIGLISNYFNIDPFHDSQYIWKAINGTEYKKFGKIEYLLDFFHYTEKDKDGNHTIIMRKPLIRIRHSNISTRNLIQHCLLINSVLSLYYGCTVSIRATPYCLVNFDYLILVKNKDGTKIPKRAN